MKLLRSFSLSLLFLSTLTGKTVQFGAWDEAHPQKLQGARAEIVTGAKREIPLYAVESPSLNVEEDKPTEIWVRQEQPAAPSEEIAVIEEQPAPPIEEIAVIEEQPAAPSEEIAVIEEQPAPPVEEVPAAEPSPYVIEESPPAPPEEVIVIQKSENSWKPANPLRPTCREKFGAPLEIPHECVLTEAPPVLDEPCYEVCTPCPKRECCSPYLGYGAGAAVIGTALAGVLIPDRHVDPDPPGPPPPPAPQTLQFDVVLGCEIGGPVTASIYLPGMVFLESFSIEFQTDNFSSVINNPVPGDYTIVLENVEEAPCFTATVILNGVDVVSGAFFSGTAPTVTFVYNLP